MTTSEALLMNIRDYLVKIYDQNATAATSSTAIEAQNAAIISLLTAIEANQTNGEQTTTVLP